MRLLQRVVVPLSLTKADTEILRYASLVARLGVSREFHFVHVMSRPTLRADDRDAVTAFDRIAWQVDTNFRDYPENLLVTCEVRGGSTPERVLAFMAERGSQLALVGSGYDADDRTGIAAQLALSGQCSVWTVPRSFPGDLKRILAPVDFSEPTRESLSLAALLGRLVGLEECLALPISEGSWPGAVDGGPAFRQFLHGVNNHALAILPVFESEADLPQAVLNCARRYDVDLIVLGLSEFDASNIKMSSQVLEQSPVPVLMMRPAAVPSMLPSLLAGKEHTGR